MSAVRRITVAASVIILLGVAAPRVGEPDRSESRAIGTIRAIVSAELAYAAVNDGHYVTPACLGNPACAPAFDRLDPVSAAGGDHGGYHFAFEPYSDRKSGEQSFSAFSNFAVVAVPLKMGAVRHRSFCADDRGLLYVIEPPQPRIERGRCLDTSHPLER